MRREREVRVVVPSMCSLAWGGIKRNGDRVDAAVTAAIYRLCHLEVVHGE